MTTRTATNKQDDQPFDFNLDAVQAEVDLTPWRVHWAGRRWEFDHMQNLDVWPLMEAADAGDVEAIMGIFRTALGAEQWAAFRKEPLPQYKMKALFDEYRKYSGLAEGESAASSGS
ncbi:hypothetical protein ACIPXV_02760 [Streptomyces libani]|uniref:hypothetical protein n=1 Tax=Streptomyces TaxID=1883 RepID=UPI0021CA277F|nr:hypothetical protein [Streptomyces sp. Isolate_219]MCR8574672.1 hypothetical protein [Streptomyces sp. Isolate_219]